MSPSDNSVPRRCFFFFRARRAPSRLRALNRERGSTLVEFALVFILCMTMLLGIAGFGHALYVYHFTSEAAREATRWAIVNGSTCASDFSSNDPGGSCNGTGGMNNGPATATDIDTYVKSLAPPGINVSNISTVVTWPAQSDDPAICSTTDNAPGCTVEVEVDYNYNFIFPLLPSGPFKLSSTSEMVIAH
jgi:Flp pilus assembly protein TadG